MGGNREYGNSIQIDGVESTTNRTQDVTVQPSVDAVQEFKVSTSAYNAEYGSSAGGVVSIETKAGTNTLHGDAFEFFRPNFTTARPYGFGGATEPSSNYKQHTFGGTLGGPVKRNKVFFFGSYQGQQSAEAYTELDSTPPMNQIIVFVGRLGGPFENGRSIDRDADSDLRSERVLRLLRRMFQAVRGQYYSRESSQRGGKKYVARFLSRSRHCPESNTDGLRIFKLFLR